MTYFFLLIMMTLLGLMLVASSHVWFCTWVGLEVMSFFILPVLYSGETSFILKLSTWKYYLVQSISSGLFLISIYLNNLTSISPNSVMQFVLSFCITVCMFLKLGVPPFHGWLFDISESLSWFKFFLLNVVQKSAPLFVLWNTSLTNKSFMMLYVSIAPIFSLLCFYNYSFRHMMVHSSIINIMWMCSSTSMDLSMLLLYLICYTMMMMSFTLFLLNHEVPTCGFITTLGLYHNFFERMMFFFLLLSLAGVPPLMGFFMKLELVLTYIESGNMMFILTLLLFSILIMSMYINISLCSLFVMKYNELEKTNFSFIELLVYFMNFFFVLYYIL